MTPGTTTKILKWLRAQCKFESLKHVVFPVIVSMNTNNQYVFTESGKGTHWVGVHLCLETDVIDIHDWVRLTDSHCEHLLPPLRAFMVQMHRRCDGLCLGQSYGLSSSECVLVIQARVHNQHQYHNAYDYGVFTSYLMYVVSDNDYSCEEAQ